MSWNIEVVAKGEDLAVAFDKATEWNLNNADETTKNTISAVKDIALAIAQKVSPERFIVVSGSGHVDASFGNATINIRSYTNWE